MLLLEARNCRCHDEPMYPNRSVGGWRCAVKTRARNRASDTKRWAARRRYVLAAQRVAVNERLKQLREGEDAQ